MFGMFKRSNTGPVAVVAPPVPFHEKMRGWVEELDWYVRESSGIISTEAFSVLRSTSDLLNEVADFLVNYPIRAEEEYILESTIRSYIPSALNIFNQLPGSDRTPGGNADVQLIEQFYTMYENINAVNNQMHENVRKTMREQSAFVQERFAAPV